MVMSAVLQVPTGPVGGPGDAEDAAFAANRAWENDRVFLLQRSERRAWIVAWTAAVTTVLAVLAVLAQGPLRQVVSVPIVVDRVTGETTIQQRLAVETVPLLDAVDKHNLAIFVRAREGYSWWWLQRDFDQVSRMAVPTVFADYGRQFEGDSALQKKLSSTEEWRVSIVNVRLSPRGRQGNRGEATVAYDRTVRATDRSLPEVTTRHLASIVFEYQPKVLAKEKDRIDNPFGFVVTAYRSDPEMATAASSSAVKQ
jgi:type IV secretion system protein VirB8